MADSRKGDRHQPTEARKKDRHKPGYVRPDRRRPNGEKRGKGRPRTKPEGEPRKGWQGRFVAVDGEGWNGRYTLLACSAIEYDLYSPRGLTTRACLQYLTSWQIKPTDAVIGYGLSYDFENLLRDIPDEDYKKLLNNEEITYQEFSLKYIPRKFIQIVKTLKTVDKNGKPRKKTVFLQDVLGYFQTSFIGALEKFNIQVPSIITEGKAMRGDFNPKDLPFIKEYNREELRLLVELMEALRKAGKDAFEAIDLKPNFTPRTWYGPGAWASNFLRQTKWIDEHPTFIGKDFETLQDEMESYLGLSTWKSNAEKRDLKEIILEIEGKKKEVIRTKKNLLQSNEGDILKRIRELGGISPRLDLWTEEYKLLPLSVKRKAGRPLDEVADELGYTVAELLDLIRNRPIKDPYAAQNAAWQDEEFLNLDYTQRQLQREWAKMTDMVPDKEAIKTIKELRDYPFAAAFFGGRIEAAAVGEFKEPLYDYDINSAYPYAIANLPEWKPEDLKRVKGLDKYNRIGMYFVEWDCPAGVNLYPFPYRSKTGNVFYPSKGRGWYMSPEVHAALLNWPGCVIVKHGYVLQDTNGAGDGLHQLPAHKLCTTAKKMALMAKIRMAAKKEKLSYEKALKLLMNSCYGKTIQQVGSHKFLEALAASWITSTCRAIISRTVGKDEQNNVISVMTDGILTRKPLTVNLGTNLGEFELKEFNHAIQFMPGVYYLNHTDKPDQKPESKYRGMDKNFNPLQAKDILWEEGPYTVNINVFVTRNLALHQPAKYGDLKYQFVPVTKEEEFTLRSKRSPGPKGFRLYKKEAHRFFEAKNVNPLELLFEKGSKPYKLDLPEEKDYDGAKDEKEMVDEAHINTLLEIDNYDLRG